MTSQSVADVAQAVFEHMRRQEPSDRPLWERYWSPHCLSVEPDGTTARGIDEMEKKSARWMEEWEIFGTRVEGPFVGLQSFSIICEADMGRKDGSVPRGWMKEVCHYTVENGKIVREEFLFGG